MVRKQDFTEGYWKAGLHNSHQYYVDLGEHAYRGLRSALEVLPRIGPDGSSECPFAEQLFRQKYEKEEKADGVLGVLDHIGAVIQEELGRRRATLATMGQTQGKLRGKRTQVCFSETIQQGAEQLKRVTGQAQEVERIATALRALLVKSKKKTFPGMAVRENSTAQRVPGREAIPPPRQTTDKETSDGQGRNRRFP